MIRFLFRALGLLSIAVGFVALVVDGTRSIATGRIAFSALGESWFSLHPGSLQVAQPAVERYVAPWLWDPVILSVLLTPTAAVGLILGAFLMAIGRKPMPKIGVVGRR